MKKKISIVLAVALIIASVFAFAACSGKTDENTTDQEFVIAVPNDTTNEARALLLLEANGIIKLDSSVGITATVKDITENPHNITFKEVEAAQVPNILQDVDYAVINSNYAIEAGLNPVEQSLAIEGSASDYVNVLVTKEGNENTDKIKALAAALESKEIADFISEKYSGSVVSVVENPGDGFDSSVDYDALKGETISVAASPAPHAEILAIAKETLAEKDITLKIVEYTDYIQPNNVVESGEIDANYFQHVPYLDDFNAENGTHLVSVAGIHVEPMGVYGGKQTSLDLIK
ncbi:MAG: MetQ/NlpA family ABC transporter substrate-binding protein [Acutalibacteraceae bacterium]